MLEKSTKVVCLLIWAFVIMEIQKIDNEQPEKTWVHNGQEREIQNPVRQSAITRLKTHVSTMALSVKFRQP
jgi:hypothetical protein